MADLETRAGRCACGAVTFEAEVNLRYGACHCEMCRRWSGGVWMAMDSDAVRFTGEDTILVWRSSDWAERGSCAECGSPLFWRRIGATRHYLGVGLFDDQSGFAFVDEVFVDEQPDHYRFAGERKRITGAENLASMGVSHD